MKHSRQLRQALTAAVLVFAAVAPLGCRRVGPGGARYAVEGTVTLNGNPVDGGKILLLPADAGSVKAHGDILGGKFALDTTNGPNAGKYKIEIVWYKKTGKKVTNDASVIDETQQVVPANYNVTSSTYIEIKPEMNTHAFDMKGAPPTTAGSKKHHKNGN
jgi:hypothetical protein